MTTKHTPGPWQVNHNNPHQVCDSDGEKRGCSPIAVTHGTLKESKANARLIAALPDLLAALQAIVDEAGNAYGHNDGPGAVNRMAFFARSAIAKAT